MRRTPVMVPKSAMCRLALVALLVALAPARADTAVPVVVATSAEVPILRELSLQGSVTAERNARLSVAIGGLVTAMEVDTGDRVEAGDLLLELDPELARLQRDAASARAAQARIRRDDARRRLEEARVLLPQRGIAETAVRDLEAALAEAEATGEQAQAEAALQEALLARHSLRAPFAGVISKRLTDLGEWLDPGQPVFELVGMDGLLLDFAVPENHLASLSPGAAVKFVPGARPAAEHGGTIESVVPVAEPGARTFLLRVRPDAGVAPDLLPGMSVTAQLQLATGRSGVTVPRDAILRYPDGRVVVWSVEKEADGAGVAVENVVTTGLAFGGRIEISAGLAAGSQVVVRGNEALQPGQALAVTGAAP
ncbi:efflux RND transporter periplasmic adaptor subunit [Haliea sp. E1-2-M8]|uniref:efflux RND transporter periplasmic adaptor subunit n=1 Tax=Haliea sp. E1-2-M8 TaxID=3064706 RepID=UPI0027194F1A|nr:efflux RND transporter periplasmic adaptor subunit [Haliea sp. E1-2-M8]MDO8862949.1 efflux RND transporter periplasmic adaptor subunit [Haliea sp. E1-2-M8]